MSAALHAEWRAVAALMLGAIALRVGCERMRLGALDLSPHAVTSGDLRDRVFALAAAAGVRLRMLYVMPTERGRIANAFAVHGDVVLLTDHLLHHLSRREVDAVLAHELAHLRRGHPRWLMVPAFAVMLVAILAGGAVDSALLWPAVLLASMLATLLTMRRFEFEADRGAVELTRDPDGLISALAALARLNHLPLDWGPWAGVLLTHPSMLQRARAIGAAAGLDHARVVTLLRDGCGDPARHTLPASAAGKSFSTRYKSEQSARVGLTVAATMAAGAALALVVVAWQWPGCPRPLAWGLAALFAFLAGQLANDRLAARPYARVRRALTTRFAAEGIDPAGAIWVGLSPTDRTRLYEGFSDWDVGFLFVRGDRLCFVGEETRFAVRREDVVTVRLGARMPGWIRAPRVVVDRRVGTFSLRPADVSRVSAGGEASWRLLGVLGAWLDGLSDGPAPRPHPLLDALAPPDLHEVTAVTPRELADPRAVVAMAVILGLLAAAACALTGLPSGFGGRSGFLDAWLAAVAAAVANLLPWWGWRERPAAPVAARDEHRRAA